MRKSFTPTTDPSSNASFSSASVAGSIQDDNMSDQCGLTQAGLEEYNSRSYYDQPVFHHQKQSSYAQSEGYHSYVSSSDSSSATPFLDRLRQESDLLSRQSSHRWSQSDLSASSNTLSTLNTTGLNNHSHNNHNNLNCNNNNSNCNIENNSSESTSSTETLKWLGSMSDVSVVSHSTSTSGISSSVSTSQLIVHSSKVRTPKRHHSESVLYMHDENQQQSEQYDIDQLHQLEHKAVNSISSNNISPNNYNNLSNSKSICSANNLSNKINENSNLNKSAPLLTNSNNCGLSTTQHPQHNNQIFNNHQQHSYHNQNHQHQSMVFMQQKQQQHQQQQQQLQQQQQQQQQQHQLQLHNQHQLKLMQTSGIPQVSSAHLKGNVTAITATTKTLSSNNQMISSSTTLHHCNSVSTSNSCNSVKNNSINNSNQLLNDTNNSNNKTTILSSATTFSISSSESTLSILSASSQSLTSSISSASSPASLSINIPSISSPINTISNCNNTISSPTSCASESEILASFNSATVNQHTDICLLSNTSLTPQSSPAPTSSSLISNVTTTTTTTTTTPSSSISSCNSYRNNNRLFPVSTYVENEQIQNNSGPNQQQQSQNQQHHHHSQQATLNQCQIKHLSTLKSNNYWQSVADRVNSYEKQSYLPNTSNTVPSAHQHHFHGLPSTPESTIVNNCSVANANQLYQHQNHTQMSPTSMSPSPQSGSTTPTLTQQQKFTYIDPNKTHRVPNPQLKAFQKNAVQSYFERQQLNSSRESFKNYLPSGNLLRPHSLQPQNSPKEIITTHVRNSLPNTFAIANIASQTQQQHHHSLNNQIMQRSINNYSTSTVISQNQQPQAQQPQNNQRLISQQLNSIDHGFSSNIEFTNGNNVPPPPPPRSRPYMPIRRSSSASDYGDFRENYLHSKQNHIPTTTAVKTLTNPEKSSFNDCGVPPPPPPPRGKASMLVRRTSSASEYAAARDKHIKTNQTISKDILGPMIMGPIISVDDWVPERPPKNPQLRIPSPDLPPPPVVIIETDSNLSNQDEPLPPPPPEILRHLRQSSNDETKSSSRRNSFAGSCNGKKPYKPTSLSNDTTAAVLNDTPPSVSKKQQSISMGAAPANAEIVRSRPSSSLSQQQMLISSTHKVILNGKLEHSQPLNQQTILNYNYPTSQQTALLDMNGGIGALQKNIDVRMSLRKRPHPAPSVPLKPIDINYLDDKNSHSRSQTSGNSVKSPPPLKPRMPIGGNDIQSPGNNSKLRVNSKASYLPRQTRDKFNSADPDHGSYKLTLTSNEDSIISQHSTITPIKHISYPDDILPPKPKCTNNNLPDVLPVGVKLQPSSPTSNGSSPKYGCNNNNNTNNNNNSPTTLAPTQSGTLLYPPGYPCNMKIIMPQCNSTSQNNYNQSVQQQQRLNRSPSTTPSTPPPPYSSMITLNQRSNQNGSYNSPTQLSDQSSPKFMSQSTIDLKKTQFLDSKETNKFCDGILSPAQSENNLSHQQQHITTQSNINESIHLSSFSSTKQREFQRTDVIRKLSLEEHHDPGEGRIVRAELVNTTLSVSPPISKSEEKISIKRESLRENIEKITQLQSKLMSAHTLDNSNGDRKILGFSTKSLKLEATQTIKNPESSKGSVKLLENIQSSVPESPIKVTSPAQFTSSSPNFTINNTSTSSEIKQKALPNIENSSTQSTNVLQRTEIILRVNPPTTETASQTDESLQTNNQDKQSTSISDSIPNSLSYTKLSDRISTPSPTLMPRRKLSEEIDCDILSQKLASLLPSNEDKLSQILAPTVYKSTADYIVNLYNPNVTPRPTKRDVATSTPGEKLFNTESTTSDKLSVAGCNGQDNNFTKLNGSINGETSLCDLTKKKEELINRLTKKLDVLTKEQISVKDDTNKNDQLGINLATKISDKVRPVDVTKFKAYIDDVGHITMLLLSLSGRLAKIENTLHGISESSTEKKILESKRDRLTEQLDEAKKLKEDIDRRGLIVYKIIEKNLTNDDCADYEYFINMKAKLIIDSREIDDKMKLGEEQLIALKETLQIQSEC